MKKPRDRTTQRKVGGNCEKLEKTLPEFLTQANHWDWEDYEKYSIFNVQCGNTKTRLSTGIGV